MTAGLKWTFLTTTLLVFLASGCSVEESKPVGSGPTKSANNVPSGKEGSGGPTKSAEGVNEKSEKRVDTSAANLSGEIRIDGSSTVYPISQAMAEEFQGKHPQVRLIVKSTGTGPGMKAFGDGECDI